MSLILLIIAVFYQNCVVKIVVSFLSNGAVFIYQQFLQLNNHNKIKAAA
jgi:hypothetical protein